ncbi:glutamine synthetase family protein [Leucothrix pacifica]|uniref:Glutamine synthetase n=1 Tax=Leucothrix pacifica TaxID=1247513 RepID=A0A317C2G1_9GAMM|nr:glutamine synthetase family protein [Leucothrix pacifica]PWQ92815.1 glutamine synthetase [Leucothrix pacifica]
MEYAPIVSAPDSVEELKKLVVSHKIEEVECTIADIHGVARGKLMPASKFVALNPTFLPYSIFFQSITGDYLEFDSEAYMTEVDIQLVPDLTTVRTLPWARSPSLMVIHDLMFQDGRPVESGPRNVLKRVLKLYEDRNWKPVVAPEIEFYLTERNTDPDLPLQPPIGRSGRQSVGRQSFSMMAIDEYEPIIEDIYKFAEVMGLEIDTLTQEGGPAQLEVNMAHGDALDLADQVFVFKRLIREAAMRHDCYATFMAKPMKNHPGSAMHIHQSVVDISTGQNIFSNQDGSASDLFHYFIGGQQKYLGASTCLLAPYVNSYRRLMPGDSAPINLEWSKDNRSAGLRVPNSGPNSRRVENRIAGMDTNPYLALASSLATGYLGMMNKIKCQEEFKGDAHEADFGLPRGLLESLIVLDEAPEFQAILGQEFCDLYKALKQHEFNEYMMVVSPWEREHLLLTV